MLVWECSSAGRMLAQHVQSPGVDNQNYTKLNMLVKACNSSTWEDQKFQVMFFCTVCTLKLAWTIRNLAPKIYLRLLCKGMCVSFPIIHFIGLLGYLANTV